MLSFIVLCCGVALAASAPNSNIFQIDLDPEEAAKYINNPPFSEPQLSTRTNVLPLIKYNDPNFRAADAGPTLGHYWKNGREIENTNDYLDEVYNAKQYHGQDGLGAYAYGYEAPESAKVENRQRSGNVQGSYVFKSGSNNDLIKVRYWADSQGFHQEDNIPKYVPKPVEEAPEVRAARIAHEKAWQEAAYANLHPGASQNQNANLPPPPNFNTYQPNPQNQNQNQQYPNQNQQYPNQNQQYQNQNQQYPNQNQQYQTQNYQSQKYQQGYQAQASEQHNSVVPSPNQGYQTQASEQHNSVVPSPNQGYQTQASEQHNSVVPPPNQGYQAQASEQHNSVVPSPNQGYQSQASEQHNSVVPPPNQGYQAQASEQQSSILAAPNQNRQERAYGPNQYQYQNQYQSQNQYQNPNQEYTTTTTTERYEEGPTGPPRGFFYSYEYPVDIIVAKSDLQGGSVNPGYPVDHDTIAHGQP